MTTQAEANRRRNQAQFWNEKQAKARTDQEIAAIWYDALRMLARNAEKNGRPPMWGALAKNFRDLFDHYNA